MKTPNILYRIPRWPLCKRFPVIPRNNNIGKVPNTKTTIINIPCIGLLLWIAISWASCVKPHGRKNVKAPTTGPHRLVRESLWSLAINVALRDLIVWCSCQPRRNQPIIFRPMRIIRQAIIIFIRQFTCGEKIKAPPKLPKSAPPSAKPNILPPRNCIWWRNAFRKFSLHSPWSDHHIRTKVPTRARHVETEATIHRTNIHRNEYPSPCWGTRVVNDEKSILVKNRQTTAPKIIKIAISFRFFFQSLDNWSVYPNFLIAVPSQGSIFSSS